MLKLFTISHTRTQKFSGRTLQRLLKFYFVSTPPVIAYNVPGYPHAGLLTVSLLAVVRLLPEPLLKSSEKLTDKFDNSYSKVTFGDRYTSI